MMTAKKYLQKLKIIDAKVNQKQMQANELRLLATGIRGMRTDEERVQNHASGDELSNMVIKYISLENDINRDIKRFINEKNIIINQIQGLDDARYIQVLYKRYIEFKSLELIAVEMGYSYDSIRHMHGHALQVFETKYLKLDT